MTPAGEKFRSTIFKLILGTVIAAVSVASPAFAQYSSGKAKLVSGRHSAHFRAAGHYSGSGSLAALPRRIDDPALTGGGSIGYNENLRVNHW